MKRVIEISVRCVLALVLTISMIYKLGIIVRPVNTDVSFNAINTFHDMPENTLEAIGYGPSHIWAGLDVMEMYRKYGIGAYNYGNNWQRFNTTTLFFKDSLRTQSPKLVLIETCNVNALYQDVDINGEIYYTRAIAEFKGKQEYLKQCFGSDIKRYLSYYVPVYAFHENWVNLTKANFLENANNRGFYATMGQNRSPNVKPISIPDPSTFEQAELSEASISLLNEIVDICSEKSIEIIFFTLPYQANYPYGDALKAYAQENGCTYLNLFEYIDRIGIDCETDFYNEGHLNTTGAVKVSDFLGEFIVNNYDVTDWRTVKENIWEQNLQ